MDLPTQIISLSKDIKNRGGRAFIVGGTVRDQLLGLESKDFDLEVFNLEQKDLEVLIKLYGVAKERGKSFGVYKLKTDDGREIDVALPRQDRKTGIGHRGFEVAVEPNLSFIEACRRRDFTINSMLLDPLTGEIIDPFEGQKDLEAKILRVTDPETFNEDPLRVIRAIQFLARFELTLEPKSAEIISSMITQLNELPRERILEEWKKLLLKAPKPSIGLQAAWDLGIMKSLYPEFTPLEQTEQDAYWHPEGNVWTHTKMVVDKAAEIARSENLDTREALIILFSGLCHDLGKPTTTKKQPDGRITSRGHAQAGEEPTKTFLARLGIEGVTKQKIVKLVIHHMRPTDLHNSYLKGEVSDGAIRRLAASLYPATISELVLVARADKLGRGPYPDPDKPGEHVWPSRYQAGEWLLSKAQRLKVANGVSEHLILGRDLIDLGFTPTPEFNEIISLSDQLRDEHNITKAEILDWLKDKSFTEAKKILEDKRKTGTRP